MPGPSYRLGKGGQTSTSLRAPKTGLDWALGSVRQTSREHSTAPEATAGGQQGGPGRIRSTVSRTGCSPNAMLGAAGRPSAPRTASLLSPSGRAGRAAARRPLCWRGSIGGRGQRDCGGIGGRQWRGSGRGSGGEGLRGGRGVVRDPPSPEKFSKSARKFACR